MAPPRGAAWRFLVPNCITLCGMGVGAWMIAAGALRWDMFCLTLLLDVADGAAARALGAATDFGAVMDSCADALNFAIAPAILLADASAVARVTFAAAGIARLVSFTAGGHQDASGGAFVGFPTPLAAGLAYAASAWGPPGLLDAALVALAALEHAPVRIPKVLGAGGLTLTRSRRRGQR